ncbi:MAG: GNAT family N-acetyltransferase [Actinobacteria bacterium HGW-Actinobacteria-4]|nr:MAG: GNAT family N-acetyltransferase [Actinobacteria bacterium HGW-Actinobacteria-4]
MTDSLLRRTHHVLAPLQRRDIGAALALCATDPVAFVSPAMQLETARDSGIIPAGLWSVRRRAGLSREFAGVVWNGANFTAVLPSGDEDATDHIRAEVAQGAISRLNRPAALVGDADLTLDMWGRLEPWWGPAREIRPRQVSMAISDGPRHVRALEAPDLELAAVRRASMDDFATLLPACVHMFKGEVGYDPMLHGRTAYEERLRQLVRGGRSYLQYGVAEGRRQVVFKAEVGALGGAVAQLQGVWVHPSLRGRGLARAGLAAVIEAVRATTAPTVSLYVNDFNVAAIEAYEAVGFQRVGDFATVML